VLYGVSAYEKKLRFKKEKMYDVTFVVEEGLVGDEWKIIWKEKYNIK
jgi:hypothetical protein